MAARSRLTPQAKTAARRRRAHATPAAATRRRRILAPRLLTLAAAALVPLLVYWPTTGYGFLLDDFVLYRTSASLNDLGSIPRGFVTDLGALRRGADTVISSYYRPIFLALSTLYHRLAGGEPFAWHAAAVVLAALIGALMCGFFLRLGFSPPVALLASLVFSLHPSHVSSVAWASGLQELLAACFVCGALHALLWRRGDGGDGLPIGLAAAAYALALLSKEVAIGLLPFAAVWALATAKSDPARSRRLWKATGIVAGVTLLYLAVRVAIFGGLALPFPGAPGFRAALPSMPVALLTYLRLLVWPAGFSIFRPERPVYGPFAAPVLLAVGVLLVLALAAAWLVKRRRELALPLAWAVVWLLPVLSLWALDPQWMVTDRYLFLPSLALPWLLVSLVSLVSLAPGSSPASAAAPLAQGDRRRERLAIVLLSLLAIVFAVLAVRYAAIFHDERTFLAAMEKAEPTSPLVFGEKGRLAMRDGDLLAARAALTRAVELDPLGPGALIALGDLDLRQGDLAAAELHYRRALVVRPYASRGFKLLAIAESRAGQRERAFALATEAARRWPDDFEAQLLHALLLGAAGDRPQAEAAFAAARRLRPTDPAVAGGLDDAMARLLPGLLPRAGGSPSLR
ncbi:MAG TPA: tetratricopeptide repeat protein [Thermoanaerobaculia bacterium]|nr:tetratricopeptide repeat protein [Thermoanaerobaculia bacterium]